MNDLITLTIRIVELSTCTVIPAAVNVHLFTGELLDY